METAKGVKQNGIPAESLIREKDVMQLQTAAHAKPTPVETSVCGVQPGVSVDLLVLEKEVLQPRNTPTVPFPATQTTTKPKVVYAAENTNFYVGTAPVLPRQEPQVESVSSDSYLWKKKLCVSVRRLSDFEISYWRGGLNQDTDEHPLGVETNPVKAMSVMKRESNHDEVPPPVLVLLPVCIPT